MPTPELLDHPCASNSRGDSFLLVPWKCPVCEGAGEKVLGARGGRFQREGLGIESRIVQCRECSLLFANPFPVPTNVGALYGDPDTYFSHSEHSPKVAANRRILSELRERSGVSGPRVLDVGSGRGELLVAAELEGIEAIGLEISESMVRHVRERHAIELYCETIDQAAARWRGGFDGIVLNAVLEHVHDPNEMIESASRLLKPGGVLYIDVPNEPNLITRIGNGWNRLRGSPAIYNLSPTWPPYHVYGFNPRSLSRLLGKHGFEIEELKVYCEPSVRPTGSLGDHALTAIANKLNTLANLTRSSGNLSLWARKRAD